MRLKSHGQIRHSPGQGIGQIERMPFDIAFMCQGFEHADDRSLSNPSARVLPPRWRVRSLLTEASTDSPALQGANLLDEAICPFSAPGPQLYRDVKRRIKILPAGSSAV